MNATTSLAHKKPSTVASIVLWVSRLFVGVLFIFSGLIKANDPIGFGYKLEEYFHVFSLSFLNEYSAWIAVVICGVEIILGALLLLGVARKSVAWGLLLLILFFTFLTFYSAFFDVVTSCGCFGDAIPLTPWQSFSKDLVLLAFILIIFSYRNHITPLFKSSSFRGFLTFLIIIFSFGIGLYTLNFLPFIDFLPYKEGNNLLKEMEIPEDAEADVYEHIYTLINTSTGEEKRVTDKVYMDEKIWEDEAWEVVGDPESRLIKKGFEPAIADLIISDENGLDVTKEIIGNPYYNFIVVGKDLEHYSPVDYMAMDDINSTIRDVAEEYPIRAVLLTASSPTIVNEINQELDLVLESFYADLVPIKSMVRANPGVLLMQDGVVIKKWAAHQFPSKEDLVEHYLK